MEIITQERLNDYLEKVKTLDNLLERKKRIMAKLGLKGVDYSKDKVTSGNGHKMTEQERYAASLERVNKDIEEIKPDILREHAYLREQIGRIKDYRYRKILVYRYIEKWKWSEIIQEFFEFEDDFEAQKNDKYHTYIMNWHRWALKELQTVSEHPFIKVQQLSLEEV